MGNLVIYLSKEGKEIYRSSNNPIIPVQGMLVNFKDTGLCALNINDKSHDYEVIVVKIQLPDLVKVTIDYASNKI